MIAEGASEKAAREAADGWWEAMTLGEHVEHYEQSGSDRKDALKLVASDRGLSKRDVYNALLERKARGKCMFPAVLSAHIVLPRQKKISNPWPKPTN